MSDDSIATSVLRLKISLDAPVATDHLAVELNAEQQVSQKKLATQLFDEAAQVLKSGSSPLDQALLNAYSTPGVVDG